MLKKQVFVTTNGCPRRALDAQRIIKYFRLNDYSITKNPKKADYIIFVTCSFFKDKEEECFRYINEFKKYKGELIIAGCLPLISPVKLKQNFKGKSIPTKDLQDIDQFFKKFKTKFLDISDSNFPTDIITPSSFYAKFEGMKQKSKRFFKLLGNPLLFFRRVLFLFKKMSVKKTAHLRISNGCIGNCAYCGIRNAIGKLQSKPLNKCLEEYKQLLEKGYRNFIILADNVGAYGLDINSSFSELLKNLSDIDKNLKVRWTIQELHPMWLLKYQSEISNFVKEKKIESILCPIQSGSERVLKLMNRPCDTKKLLKCFLKLKKLNSNLILDTHILVGFPSETHNDFLMTLNMAKKIGFDNVCIYPYYDSYKTLSYFMDNKLEEKTIKERIKIAREFLFPAA